jgi:hypothetical protein
MPRGSSTRCATVAKYSCLHCHCMLTCLCCVQEDYIAPESVGDLVLIRSPTCGDVIGAAEVLRPKELPVGRVYVGTTTHATIMRGLQSHEWEGCSLEEYKELQQMYVRASLASVCRYPVAIGYQLHSFHVTVLCCFLWCVVF